VPPADLTVDGSGLLCVRLLMKLRAAIAQAPAGTVVHILTTDPAAPLDLNAWCHLTGHSYNGAKTDETPAVHVLTVTAQPRRTRADRPWHPADSPPPGPDPDNSTRTRR
jgi:tRNA 2-thiouridine synthesizing protein A